MASLSRRSEVGELLNRMTLGVVKTLENKPGVCDVRFLDKKAAEKAAIYLWEQKNMCVLPNDLKDFYLTTDGISIQWSIEFDGSTLPVGNMEINSISNLTPLNQSIMVSGDKPTLLDVDDLSDDEDSQGNIRPHLDERNKCFELDCCLGYAKVCLVYNEIATVGFTDCSPEIWLLDRSLHWSYLASSFQSYFRMLVVHLGLPLWQYRFTQAGLSPETKQWFHLYASSRINESEEDRGNNVAGELKTNAKTDEHLNQLDINRVFKGKTVDAMKSNTKTGKKKQANNPKTSTSRLQGMSGLKSFHR